MQFFSFNQLMNNVKGVGKKHHAAEVDLDWLEKGANPKQKKDWKEYNKFCD